MNNNDYRSDDWDDEQYPYKSYYDTSYSCQKKGSKKPRKNHTGLVVFLILAALAVGGVYYLKSSYTIDYDSSKGGFSLSIVPKNGVFTLDPEEDDLIPSIDEEPDEQPHDAAKAPTGDGTVLDVSSSDDGTQALSLSDIYKKVSPSVVGISCTGAKSSSTGTGIIMSDDGYIITNHHVIDDSWDITVQLQDDTEYPAAIVGSDELSDLAVIKIDASGLAAAEFGDDQLLQVGDEVSAIGNPLGLELKGTMTNGIISAINRNVVTNGRTMTLIQTNAALNAGNSGGPLINSYGQVVGINTMKMSSYISSVEGLGFAIPISLAKPIVDELISLGYVSGRPEIGITGREINTTAALYYRIPGGVMVDTVASGTDAEAKGLCRGDIITQVNGEDISSMDELNSIKNRYEAGDTITLTVYRDGQEMTMDIVLSDAGKAEQ